MPHVLIIGAGFSGCTVANELAGCDVKVTIAEKSDKLGGKVRNYGCKATDKCNNCGVCLAGGLWEKTENNSNIDIIYNSKLVDMTGKQGDFSAKLKTREGMRSINNLSAIVVAAGFEESSVPFGHLIIERMTGIIRGLDLEKLCMDRSGDALFDKKPAGVAFIQCVGSRDKNENSGCSRVCCGYSTRAAKVIRQIYPECRITFFYMEMQAVSQGDYFRHLKEDIDIEFIKCRPLKITGGEPVIIEYEEPARGRQVKCEFDYVVLSEGINPPEDSFILAEICGLGQDKNGFLKPGGGVFVTGCAKQPAKIEEVFADSVAVAKQIRREI